MEKKWEEVEFRFNIFNHKVLSVNYEESASLESYGFDSTGAIIKLS